MKKILLFTLLLLFSFYGFSQDDNFQQQVNYEIHTELFPADAFVKSYETVTYKNNSPDTLNFIYFHLWANGYRNKHTALAKQMAFNGSADLYFHAKKIGGYIDSIDFSSNGEKLTWEYDKKHIDICKVLLNEPLMPGQSVQISTPFVVKLPEDISRMGHKDSTFQITQWYPKPAVYDQYGWHQMPYLNQGEFYSEFGNFDVYITVPKQQVVGATGNMHNPDEIKWMKELKAQNLRGFELENPVKTPTKTLHYSEQNIHDFAWFCSEKYYVDYDSVFTPENHQKVTTWALFTDDYYSAWQNATKYVNAAIKYYSEWVGDYPYNNCTAVEGALSAGGGMEYPTITVISPSANIETVIVHEVGHNWFYGMLGFNERRYPMLDEGINSYYDHRYSYEILQQMPMVGKKVPIDKAKGAMQLSYLLNSYVDNDQPLNLHSSDYSKLNYGMIIYEKMPEALIYLNAYCGRPDFDSTMHHFFTDWKFKHPYPKDFENNFKKYSTADNFDWFFNGYAASNGKSDYSIKYNHNTLIIKNKGSFTAPNYIVGYNDTIPIDTTWFEPFDGKMKLDVQNGIYTHFILDPANVTMDYNKYNNFTKTHGLHKNFDKLKFGMKYSVMDYTNRHISILPFPFYTNSSKLMLGSIISNAKIPPQKLTYIFMPIYSFGFKQLEGSAFLMYKHPGHNGLPGITYTLLMNRYTYRRINTQLLPSVFRNLKANITFDLKNRVGSDTYSKKLSFSMMLFNKFAFIYKSDNVIFDKFTPIFNLQYEMMKKSKFYPVSFKLNADFYANTYNLWAEFNYKVHFTSLKDGLEIRLFSGSNVSATGTDGYSDFKNTNFFWNRSAYYTDNTPTLWGHQFVDNYGGLSFYYPYQNYDFVNAVNLKLSIPKVPIIKFYYNFVSRSNFTLGKGIEQLDFQAGLYETGVMFNIIPEIFAIYFPLYGSKELMDYNEQINKNVLSHFRFTFKIENYRKFINIL